LWSVTPRPIHFVAKAELWEVSWLGWILDRLWAFPVRRGAADREMIATASRLLEGGDLLGMFPEGTRRRDHDDDLGPAHGGVAFLALRAGVPVVPVGIAGTELALPAGAKFPRFVPVSIVVGEPILPDRFEGGRKERMEAMTVEIMKGIAQARDRARGGLE
jgi:1-acyl-sn-glycerol-3-phosphate acyltransferase